MLYSSIINDGSFVLILSVAILDAGPPNHGNQMMTVSVFQDIHTQASTLHMNLAVVGFLGTSGSFCSPVRRAESASLDGVFTTRSTSSGIVLSMIIPKDDPSPLYTTA